MLGQLVVRSVGIFMVKFLVHRVVCWLQQRHACKSAPWLVVCDRHWAEACHRQSLCNHNPRHEQAACAAQVTAGAPWGTFLWVSVWYKPKGNLQGCTLQLIVKFFEGCPAEATAC